MILNIERAMELSEDLGAGPYREAELLWLAAQAKRSARTMEIGCWIGATTRALAENAMGMVWCVDMWDGGTDEYIKGRLAEETVQHIYVRFRENTKDLGNLNVIRGNSVSVARSIFLSERCPLFNMIYIDASHDYESVKSDIRAWKFLLADDGLLCGDDFDEELFPGVVKAVKELLPNARKIAGSIWADVPGKYK